MSQDLPALFHRSLLPMWVYHPQDLRFLAVNDAAVQAYGYSRDEFLRMTLNDIRPSADFDALRHVVDDSVHRPSSSTRMWRHFTKSGELHYVEIYAQHYEYHGETCRLVHVVDLTDHVKTLETLQDLQQELEERVSERTFQLEEANRIIQQQSEERLALLMDDMQDVIWLLRQDNLELLYLNKAGERFFGGTREQLNSQSVAERQASVHPDDRAAILHMLSALSPDNPYVVHEYRATGAGGEQIWRESRIRYHPPGLLGMQAALLLGMTSDITTRKGQQAELEASLEAQRILMAEIHHRVKNNLSVLISLVQLQQLQLESSDNPVTAADALRDVHNRLMAMALVHQKLYQHGFSGHLQLTDYVAELTQQIQKTFESTGSETHLDVLVVPLRMDLLRALPLGLILNELLTNTWKHGLPDGRGSILIRIDADDIMLRLRYADSGNGFDPALLDRGTGVSLIRALTRQLKGTIELTSQPHFSVVLDVPLLAEMAE